MDDSQKGRDPTWRRGWGHAKIAQLVEEVATG